MILPSARKPLGQFFYSYVSLSFLNLLFFSFAFSEEPLILEKIVVKTNKEPVSETSLHNNYSVQTISASSIEEGNINCLPDILNDVSGMDLRYRGTFGVQGDLSLRGSSFEQVGVLIDGINVMDPQTGHHNLDIPLTPFDIERIEVIKEGDASLYGKGAFSGSLNFITKKPTKKSLNVDTLFGGHALFGQTLSFSNPDKNLSARVSFDHKISKAARANTDFENNTASIYLNKDLHNANLDTLFGYQKKDFGADSFYSNLFPEEEEHTETFFAKSSLDSKLGFGSLKNSLFFRKHRDKFILRRNNPTSVNYHTTFVYGLSSQLNLPLEYGDILLGVDTGTDQINSTNLGKHSRLREAGLIGFIPDLGEKLTLDTRLRVDNYQKWGGEESYNFGFGYKVINEKLKIKGSFSHAFRLPSFTELYYSDAANKGELSLKAEKSDNFRLGLDFKENIIELGLDGFLRQGKNLIDWTRTTQTGVWQATNLGRVDFYGIELNSNIRPNLNFKAARLEKIMFSYNYTTADKKASGFFSKYALDILKHQYILDIYSLFLGLNLNWQLSYEQRYYGETYFVGNLYFSKKIKSKDFTFEPFIKIDNFSNTKYTEISGVLQPGRWIKGGLKFEW